MIIPRCNADQMNAALLLFSCKNGIAQVMKDIPQRVDAAGIREDLEQVGTILTKAMNALVDTYPEEKREAMERLKQSLLLMMTTSRSKAPGYTELRADVLDTLVTSAHENCKLCTHPHKCNTCKLGKALDKSTPEERGPGGSWADIWV